MQEGTGNFPPSTSTGVARPRNRDREDLEFLRSQFGGTFATVNDGTPRYENIDTTDYSRLPFAVNDAQFPVWLASTELPKVLDTFGGTQRTPTE